MGSLIKCRRYDLYTNKTVVINFNLQINMRMQLLMYVLVAQRISMSCHDHAPVQEWK